MARRVKYLPRHDEEIADVHAFLEDMAIQTEFEVKRIYGRYADSAQNAANALRHWLDRGDLVGAVKAALEAEHWVTLAQYEQGIG